MASEPMAHVAHAVSTPVNVFALPELSSDVVRNIDSLVRDFAAVMSRRETQLQYWKSRAHALEPARREWRASLPAERQAVSGKLHFPLIKEMLAASGHTDSTFSLHLEHGFPVAGPIDAGGAGIPDLYGRLAHGRPAAGVCPNIDQLRTACNEVNAETIGRARPGLQGNAVWAKHKQEVLKVDVQVHLSGFDTERCLLVDRFGLEEVRGGKKKVRIIDNFRKNFVNAYSSLWERIWNDGPDDFTHAIHRLQANGDRVLIG